jgi:transposase
MVDYREILRLSSDPKNSQRSIELIVHSSRHTIRDVQEAAKAAGVSWPLDESVTNEMLREVLFPDTAGSVQVYVTPDYATIHRDLARSGVNLTLLWTEYCAKCEAQGKKPYQYTQFCEKYRQWARVTKATMRIQHKPGDAMEVDWAGNTLDIHDPVTGEISKAYLFIAVLPCSGFAYAELCEDMKMENWLLCHVHAYSYFGGVARLLIPDNLKTGVKSNTRYETVLNRSYQELAEHYDTAIVPTRVKHPQDKSHAEGTVKFASTWILAALRDHWFFSVADAKAAVSEKLEALNDRPFKGREGCRRSAYLDEEKEFMRPLPNTPYEAAVWSPELKVGLDYLVSDGLNKYSVPFDLIGEKVSLRLTKMLVEVFYRGTRVAVHTRERMMLREPVVKPEHMPPEHRKYLNYNENDFTSWAESIGENTHKVVRHFLTSGKEAEQGFKACASMTKLADRYGPARLEAACEYLLSFAAAPSIRTLRTILKNGQERASQQAEHEKAERTEQHGITRGADYFRKGGASHD